MGKTKGARHPPPPAEKVKVKVSVKTCLKKKKRKKEAEATKKEKRKMAKSHNPSEKGVGKRTRSKRLFRRVKNPPGKKKEDESLTTDAGEGPRRPVKYTMRLKIKVPKGPRKEDESRNEETRRREGGFPKFHPHPLLINDVLANMMKGLGVPDIRTCQLVSRVWYEEAARVMSPITKVHLRTFDDLNSFMKIQQSRHRQKPPEFTHFRLGPQLNLQDALMQKFLNKFGPHITFLHLDWTHWIPASLRKILIEKLPVLEELIICSQRLCDNIHLFPSGRGGEQSKPTLPNMKILRLEANFQSFNNCHLLLDLLQIMPNLRLVTGYKSASECKVSSAPLVSRLDSLRYEQSDNRTDRLADVPELELILSKYLYRFRATLKLHHLENLKFVFDPDMITYLASQVTLQLKTLEVIIPSNTFSGWNPRPSQLFNYCTALNKSLHSLKLSYSSVKLKLFGMFDSVSRLRSLRHLHLHRVSGSLDFLGYLPQLKSLYMTQEDFIEFYDEFHIEECRPHKLEILKLYYTNWSVSSVFAELPRPAKVLNVVQVVVQRFPQLKSLRMESLTDKALGLIYTSLPHLEELEATNGAFSAFGITGVPVVNQGQTFGRKYPDIKAMKDLKRLRLESNKMTDYGVTSGIIGVTSLEELTLMCYKLTDESLLLIMKQLDNLRLLKTEFCYEFSASAVRQVKRHFQSKGGKAIINPFCGTMEVEKVHEFLNENGPLHVSIPDFPNPTIVG